ncbi:MAG TPA: hypothetical protein VM802_22075 [Chitinophaga sp.]|uniref:hypothetical protein n=1 Tax=Chitinophaga sp. TaxID=1869181 RepID=UPI002BBCC099|nr:hypothetical protein [Chitinophaga sp.]HVI47574.1 hypothetical protein [Chitinophaga sp.]
MHLKLYTCSFILLLCASTLKAQQGLNSIYSAYGIGDLEEKDYSRNFGLGSTGIGRRSSSYLNELNPASYSALPMQNFMLDISVKAQRVSYEGAGISQTGGDINFKRLAIGFKAARFWGISAGVTPFSTVDYKLLNNKFITGTGNPVTSNIEGAGGINRAYISNAFQLNKHFSVGVSTGFLFGPVNVSQTLGSDSIVTHHNQYAFKPNFTVGAQYNGKVSKDWQLGVGATYRFQTKLKFQENLNITDENSNSYFKQDQDPSYFTLPAQYGAGLSLTNGKITWVADYRHQQWNGLNNKGTNYYYQDGERYSTGIEYAITKHYYNRTFEGAILQAGFSYNKLPLVVKSATLTDISGTIGVSLPSKNGQLRYYVGIEAGQRGSKAEGLVKENYVNAVFHFSLRDIWFIKRLAD